ncbi:MAG: hypothetical protein A3G18_04630 [Rhodospirillales bacterium RIFCSPLOWO2_12_FULL_58_28]|nr:MAG: hypothetical protein A3H92_09420 [Rhodospirillales bacterium RIFCSPLOWO2_02_FULL_58_16]OHC76962.1 MAG: hypothetical protein A3G18_04630 [Rhodospirillales bacterium RIFCSPLOWO2_12_FULL_58_28]
MLALAALLGACDAPSYVDSGDGSRKAGNPFSGLTFHVYDSYKTDPPKCVAILPLTKIEDGGADNAGITIDQTEVVRRSFYAHLSPHGKRDVEIPRVDFVLKDMSEADRKNTALVGERLNCDALIVGNVTEYGKRFLGLYSSVAVGAELQMVRADTGEPLWEGSYESISRGGSVPMSLIGIASGVLDAALNLQEETLFKVLDNLARHLVTTIPDNSIAVLEDPVAPVNVAVRTKKDKALPINDFIAGLSKKSAGEQKQSLLAAINGGQFKGKNMITLHEALIRIAPGEPESYGLYAHHLADEGDYANALAYADNALALNGQNGDMHFLKGRMQIKLDDLDGADASLVRAVAMNPSSSEYLAGLGYLNSLRGNHDRALAAYQMAVDLDADNGFSHYNMGATFYNGGELQAARDSFYKAGLAYLKIGDYGQTEKAVADLRDLASQGVKMNNEIKNLEGALASLKEKGKNNA